MKQNFKCASALLSLCCFLAANVFAQNCKVTFQADFRGVDVKDRATIGLRGDKAPLDWNKTLTMTDPDRDGIYTATVDFPSCKTGELVEYKYFQGNGGWENDDLGPLGNRSVSLTSCAQQLPVEKYNHLENFSQKAMLMEADQDRFSYAILITAMGKKRGLNSEAVAQEIYDFWKNDRTWLQQPQNWMLAAKISQATSPNGKFEELENTDGKVRYKVAKNWDQYFGDKGEIKGVTKAELTRVWKKYNELIAAEKGWKLGWKEGVDSIEITLSSEAAKE